MTTLGERIRKLRKQQKQTLETVAGTELTKGMLSLIENNKANPSMESLNYIANQLNVDVTELLEEVSTTELREVLEKAELLANTKDEDLTDKEQQIINLIAPYVPKLVNGYEAARLLELYSRNLPDLSESEVHLKRVATMYEQLNLTAKRGEIGMLLAIIRFMNHHYLEALTILQEERAKLEANPLWIDPLSRLDYDYYEAIFYSAVGKNEEAIRITETAIHYSNKHKIFKQIDNLYRLAASYAMMTDDKEKMDYYLNKLLAYSEFADDVDSKVYIQYDNLHYLNSYKKMYEEADHLYQTLPIPYIQNKIFSSYFLLERGKTLFGLHQFEEALQKLEAVVIPEFSHHPIDLSIFYEKEAYMALCYLALGYKEKALNSVIIAMDNIAPMPDTPYKTFIHRVYEQVKNAE